VFQFWEDIFRRFDCGPFKYSSVSLALAAGATANATIVIKENTAFALSRIVGWSFLSPATHATLTQVTVMLTDQGSGRTLMDRKLPLEILNGFSAYPQWEPIPHVFAGNSAIGVEITSLEAANAAVVYLVLYGVHMYNKGTLAPVTE